MSSQRQNKRTKKNQHNSNKTNLHQSVKASSPIVAIPIFGTSGGELLVQGDECYTVVMEKAEVVFSGPKCVKAEAFQKIAAAYALFVFSLGLHYSNEQVFATWPDWKYLTEGDRADLASKGIEIFAQKERLLMTGMPLKSLGLYAFWETNLAGLIDAWLELIYHDFALETEINFVRKEIDDGWQHTEMRMPNYVIPLDARLWVSLQNCVIRIDSIWECISRFIVPMYFVGSSMDASDHKAWKKLVTQIQNLVSENPNQSRYFQLLITIYNDYRKGSSQNTSQIKQYRDAFVHSITNRPPSVFPPSESKSAVPTNIKEMYKLIVDERSRLHEAIITCMGVIISKSPINEVLQNH